MTMQQQMIEITTRPLQGDADFWRVRELLVATYSSTPLGFNWDVRRWDGARFHHATDDWLARCAGRVQLWATATGQVVGAVNPEGTGDAHLQIDPKLRGIEAEMVAWAEEHLAAPNPEGRRQLEIFVYDYDTQRQQLLKKRGYMQMSYGGAVRRLRVAEHKEAPTVLADGYALRTTEAADLANCQRIADLLNAAFDRNFHTAIEFHNFTRQAPCFRPDLDLVAVAADGAFAAYVGIAYDETNRHAVFEPVCTHPAHRRHGLARALMIEGLHRLKALGAIDVSVDTGDMIPANRLYDSIGFTEVCLGHGWRKEF
jgi:mycothiol synthase